jgi:hypothetical protein
VTLLPPCNYDPRLYLAPSDLLDEVLSMKRERQLEFVELLSGSIYRTSLTFRSQTQISHIFWLFSDHFWYSVPSARSATVAVAAPDMIPILNHVLGEALSAKLARQKTTSLHWTYQKTQFVFPPLSPLALQILSMSHVASAPTSSFKLSHVGSLIAGHIDGKRTLAEIHSRFFTASDTAPSRAPAVGWTAFLTAFNELHAVLNSMDRMYLSSVPAFYENSHYHSFNITCPQP